MSRHTDTGGEKYDGASLDYGAVFQNSSTVKHRKMRKCHRFHLLDTAIYHYVFILQSPCRILTCASEYKKV